MLFDPRVLPGSGPPVLDARFDPSSFEPMVFGPDAVIPYPVDESEAVEELQEDWIDACSATRSATSRSGQGVAPGAPSQSRRSGSSIRASMRTLGIVAADSRRSTTRSNATWGSSPPTISWPAGCAPVWVYVLVLVGGLWYLRSASSARRGASVGSRLRLGVPGEPLRRPDGHRLSAERSVRGRRARRCVHLPLRTVVQAVRRQRGSERDRPTT